MGVKMFLKNLDFLRPDMSIITIKTTLSAKNKFLR